METSKKNSYLAWKRTLAVLAIHEPEMGDHLSSETQGHSRKYSKTEQNAHKRERVVGGVLLKPHRANAVSGNPSSAPRGNKKAFPVVNLLPQRHVKPHLF